jgi:SnoaL-like domain
VDENGGQTAHDFYLPGGLYVIGNNRFEGQEQIRTFYARRRYGTAMTRHLVSNVRVLGENERYARILGVMSLYRADGKSPFQGSRPPAMIADFEAECVLGDGRYWRFRSHVLRPFIVSGDLPASIAIRPQTL